MVLVEIAVLVVVLIVFGVYHVKRSQQYWADKNVTHLEPVSFWGNMENPFRTKGGLKYDLKNGHDELKKRGYKHGGIYLFTQAAYLVVDPEVIKMVLTKDFQYFTGRGLPNDEKVDPLTGHLFNLDGERWKNMRVKLTPTFTSGKMKLMFGTLLNCGTPMLERIGDLCKKRESFDIKEILSCYTTDVIGSCAFGLDCNSFKEPDAEFRSYGRKLFAPRPRIALVQFLLFILPGLMKKLRFKIIPQDIESFFMNAVKNVIDYRTSKDVKRNDFIQILLEMQEKSRETGQDLLSLEQIAAQSFVFFAAGFETSSTTMAFCLHELAFNQPIQEKLRKEIRETMKKNDGQLTYDGIMGMKYLDQVVNETLRKYPPAPMLFRKCNADYKLPGTDSILAAGTTVFISTLGLHMDEEYYPDPEKFDPDRFSEENRSSRPQYAFLPFGEGPRICIGARFGLMQAKTGVAMILDNYRVTPGKGESYKLQFDPKLLITTKKGNITLNAEKL